MNGHSQCPACGSLSTHVTKGEFKASGFQAFGNRVCDRCGTAWTPPCPRWAAIASIVTGCVVLGVILAGTGFLLNQRVPANFNYAKAIKVVVMFGFFAVMGLWACSYGMNVLLGRAGEIKILGKVFAAPAAPETSEPGSGSLTDSVCVGCQRPVPPGSAYCPHCGRPQAS
jgi:hypothetical protein